MTAAVLVFAGGGAGSLLRYLLGIWFRNTALSLPVATFAANMTACLVFAIFILLDRHRQFSVNSQLFVLTGFCGGLSTFSAFGYETWILLSGHAFTAAAANVLVSISLSLMLFYAATR